MLYKLIELIHSDSPSKNGKQDHVIHAVKKLLDIAFQHEARTCAVLTDFSCHALKSLNTLMGAIPDTARKRCWDKCRFKDRIDGQKNGMVHNTIPNAGLMDMALFRIANIETGVRAMLVSLVLQFMMKSENLLFQIPFKSHNVRPVLLITPKCIPCQKEIF